MATGDPGKDQDLASEGFWSRRWSRDRRSSAPVNPCGGNPVVQAYHRVFEAAFAGLPTHEMSLVEIGCARSRWLPYFKQRFGFEVGGLDYSQTGCEQAREILATAGLSGEIVNANLFDPPDSFLERFDVLVSFGVVEHFDDPATCLHACARLLRPNGRMVTFIPNMRGGVGLLQRVLAPEVHAVHVPLTPRDLEEAHRRIDLEVTSCRYLMTANWGVVSVGERRPAARAALRRGLSGASKTFWALERAGLSLPPNRLTSPYVVCTAIKPG